MSSSSPSCELSVLIPALNEGAYLRRTVECVRDTAPEVDEIIVVDDGSRDGCADFLRTASPCATLIEPGERIGAIGARNKAAAAARGDVLVFLDAHMEMRRSWLAPLVARLSDPAVGAVSPAIGVMGHEEQRGFGLRWVRADLQCAWLAHPREEPYSAPILPGACLAMRRDVFLSVGGFDRGLVRWGSEDSELSLRLWRLGYELAIVPSVTVAHLFRERHPYEIDQLSITHNNLRLAFVHFCARRWTQVVEAAKRHACFSAALALLTEGDAFSQRAFMRRHAVRDDDEFFHRFGDIC